MTDLQQVVTDAIEMLIATNRLDMPHARRVEMTKLIGRLQQARTDLNPEVRIQVVFSYDHGASKWEPTVHRVQSSQDACDAFNAVMLTCHQLDPQLMGKHRVVEEDGVYTIEPAV